MVPLVKRSIEIMTIDSQKRSTMKLVGLATGAMAAPGLAAAACYHGKKIDFTASANAADSTSTALRGTGLVVSFTDAPASGNTRQVIVTNTSDKAVKLSHVYPGLVSTPDGQYDLNSLLVNGSREFAAKQATTLTIESVKTADVVYATPKTSSDDAWISVRTRDSRINGGKHVTTVRHMFS